MSKKSQAGFIPVFLLATVVGLTVVIVAATNYLKNQSHQTEVQGVFIARGGDDSSNPSSGSSDSSTPSGPSGVSSNDSGRGGLGSNTQSPPTSNPSDDHRQGGSEHPTEGLGNNKIRIGGDKPLPLPALLNGQRNKEEHKATNSAEIENEIENEDVAHLTFRPNGRHLEIETKDASGEAHTIPEASNSGFLRIKLPGKGSGGSIEIQQTVNGLLVVSGGQTIQTNFPLNFDKTSGQLSVQFSDGSVRMIRILPNQASEIAKNAGIDSELGQIQLASSSGNLIYKMHGQKTVRILGFIPITIPVLGDVNAETGIASTDLPWWAKLFQ